MAWELQESEFYDEFDLKFLDQFIDNSYRGLEQLNSLKTDSYSDCQKNILEAFLNICIRNGYESVRSSQKMLLSIQMAICDYKAADAEFPQSCILENECLLSQENCDINSCLSQLIKSPTLYNTYHSYLLNVGSMCKQESLPYEKDQIIRLYSGLTKTISTVVKELRDVMGSTEDHLKYLNNHMMTVHKEISEALQQQLLIIRVEGKKQLEQLNKDLLESMNETKYILKNLVGDLEGFKTEANHVLGVILENLAAAANLSEAREVIEINNIYKGIVLDSFKNITELNSEVLKDSQQDLELYHQQTSEITNMMENKLAQAQMVILAQDVFNQELISRVNSQLEESDKVLYSFKKGLKVLLEEAEIDLQSLSERMNVTPKASSFIGRVFMSILFANPIDKNLMILLLLFVALCSLSIGFLSERAKRLIHNGTAENHSHISLLKYLLLYSLGSIAITLGIFSSKGLFEFITRN